MRLVGNWSCDTTALLGGMSGDAGVGVGVTAGLPVGEGVAPADDVPVAGTVAVPVTVTRVACAVGCRIVQTNRLAERTINSASVASNGNRRFLAKTCSRDAGGCGTSVGCCSAGVSTCCVTAALNAPSSRLSNTLYPPHEDSLL